MKKRTLKQDRELAVKLAEKLGHEMGGWGWWACLPKRKAHCRLCGDWIGITEEREWKYDPNFFGGHNSGITGTAIEEDYELRKTKCTGVAYRARERSRWQKRVKEVLSIIKKHPAFDAAKILCGEKP